MNIQLLLIHPHAVGKSDEVQSWSLRVSSPQNKSSVVLFCFSFLLILMPVEGQMFQSPQNISSHRFTAKQRCSVPLHSWSRKKNKIKKIKWLHTSVIKLSWSPKIPNLFQKMLITLLMALSIVATVKILALKKEKKRKYPLCKSVRDLWDWHDMTWRCMEPVCFSFSCFVLTF